MGAFWNYFKDVLGWNLLHHGGPLAALAQGLAGSLDAARVDVFWLRDQLHPATCEDAFVALHGRSRGVARHPLETGAQYRRRVVKAWAWQRLGSRSAGLPQVLAHYGYPDCRVRNMRGQDQQRWAEFTLRVGVPVEGMNAQDYRLITWTANETKPARSVLAGLETETTARAAVRAASILAVGTVVTLSPATPKETGVPGAVNAGGYIHGITTIALGE
jgi:P2-related tail formation protein